MGAHRHKILQDIYELAEEELEAKRTFVPGKTRIPATYPDLQAVDVATLADCVLGYWYTEHKWAAKFKALLKERVQRNYVSLTNSGSSAVLAAMTAITQTRDDSRKLVLTCATGFPTTVSPIYQCGKIPFYIDIEEETLSPNLSQIQDAIHRYGDEICGAIFAHTLGFPFNEFEVRYILGKRFLISDCCDALGATIEVGHEDGPYKLGQYQVGYFSDMSTYSFFPAHHITSLDYNEVIIYYDPRENESRVHIEKIGDFVSRYKNDVDPRYFSVSFDKKGRLSYKKITGVVEHPVNESLYKIKVQTGRSVVVSASHSLFSKDRYSDDIYSVRTSDLSIGDFVLVPTSIPPTFDELTYVSIDKYALGSWKPYTDRIKITNDLARFLGLFVAEGSFNKTKRNYTVVFTFGSDEIEYANFCLDVSKDVFSSSGNMYVKDSSIQVRITGKSIYEFLLKWCGKGAENKKVPDFIYSSSSQIQKAFIDGYYDGDGSHHDTYGKHVGYSRDCKTVSKVLATGLFYLLLHLGFQPRWGEVPDGESDFGAYKSKTLRSYSVCYSNKSVILSSGFRGDSKSKKQIGDLSLAKIVSIDLVEPTTNFVYDISVDGFENFVGGLGFALHNSGEGGAVATYNKKYAEAVEKVINWGRSCYCLPGQQNTCGKRFSWEERGDLPEGWDHKYIFDVLGYNLKMTDLQAALGYSQLTRLEELGKKRLDNYYYLRNCLDSLYGRLYFPIIPDWSYPSPFGFPMIVNEPGPKDVSSFVSHLQSHNIETRRVFGGNLTKQPGFKNLPYRRSFLDGSDMVMGYTIWISSSPTLTKEMMDYMVEVIFDYF